MGVGLFTSRIVLEQLGVDDYGVYNVVGGVVTLLSFLNGSMSASTQRYLTYDLGSSNPSNITRTFNTSLQIHFALAIGIVIVTEIVGLWMIRYKLVIPPESLSAAYWVFQCSLISLALSFLNIPFTGVVIAYERMKTFAYLSVMDALLKLGIAYALCMTDHAKLQLYALLMLIVPLLNLVIYGAYCFKSFEHIKFRMSIERDMIREMSSFAGWSLWGNIAGIGMTQGVNIILNMFFGPVVNAARAVAVQIQGVVTQFARNFQIAVNPQITKTYASGELYKMYLLIFRSSKFSLLLLMVLTLPILTGTPFLLSLWLKEVPEYTVVFTRVILLITIVDASANPMITAAGATGNIKKYQLYVGGVLLLNIPLVYLAFKCGLEPVSAFLINLGVMVMAFIIRLYMLKSLICFPVGDYCRQVLGRCVGSLVVCAIWYCVATLFIAQLYPSALSSCIVMGVSVIISAGASLSALDKAERQLLRKIFDKIVRRKDDRYKA